MIARLATVLAATDLSTYGDSVLPYAYALAGDGGTVHLLHVIEPVVVPSPLYAHYSPGVAPTPDQRRLQVLEVEQRLRALVPPEASGKGIRTQVEVAESDLVSRAVVDAASRVGADVICIGSHGRGGVLRLLLGSVAEATLRASAVPVLVVRPQPVP